MTGDTTCTRCGADVPSIMSGPPDKRDRWWRNQIRMTRREVHHVMHFRIFTRRWLPEDPSDQVRETYTTLDLCDRCAGEVFLFAQGKKPARNGGSDE